MHVGKFSKLKPWNQLTLICTLDFSPTPCSEKPIEDHIPRGCCSTKNRPKINKTTILHAGGVNGVLIQGVAFTLKRREYSCDLADVKVGKWFFTIMQKWRNHNPGSSHLASLKATNVLSSLCVHNFLYSSILWLFQASAKCQYKEVLFACAWNISCIAKHTNQ